MRFRELTSNGPLLDSLAISTTTRTSAEAMSLDSTMFRAAKFPLLLSVVCNTNSPLEAKLEYVSALLTLKELVAMEITTSLVSLSLTPPFLLWLDPVLTSTRLRTA